MMRTPPTALGAHARERLPPLLVAGGAEQTPRDPVFSLALGTSVHVADYRKNKIAVTITI